MGIILPTYRDPITGKPTSTPITVARANLAEGKPYNAPRATRNTFGFLNPILDAAISFVSPPLAVAYFAARSTVEQRRAARDAAEAAATAAVITELEPLPESLLQAGTSGNSFDFSQSRLGGVPAMFLAQLGSGLAQQTAAVRVNAAKASGRRGGMKSARKRRAKKKHRRAHAVVVQSVQQKQSAVA